MLRLLLGAAPCLYPTVTHAHSLGTARSLLGCPRNWRPLLDDDKLVVSVKKDSKLAEQAE